MLIEFSVKNFGPIKDTQTLSMIASSDTELEDYYVYEMGNLRLLKMAVLYGPNASGKTTVLKALDFLRNLVLKPTLQKSDKLDFTPFLFDEKSQHEPSLIRLIFLQEGVKYDYEISFTQNYVLSEKLFYYPKGRQSEFFTRITDTKNEVSSTNWGSKVKISHRDKIILEGNTLWNEPVLAAFNKSNIQSEELQQVHLWFTFYLITMINPNTKLGAFAEKIQETSAQSKLLMSEFINKADIQINNFEIIKEEKELNSEERNFLNRVEVVPILKQGNIISEGEKLPISIDKKTDKYLFFNHSIKSKDGQKNEFFLPWYQESQGTIKYYGLSAVLTNLIINKNLNTIDEIETSIHPDLMKHFILTFLANAKQSQLILTTHNLSFLEEKDILRKDAIWFTQKREDGSTELYSLADFDSSVFRKNASIINAYKIGKLGAKPNLGSIFIQAE